jgi:hypothetical protein
MSSPIHQALFDGPIDVVGDVHGEFTALCALLTQLGYSAHGEHPQGRRLVFLGDLCDRGPDSPAVIKLVKQLMERGLAQCLMGNHELNVLRETPKNGNGWFFAHDHDQLRGRFLDCTPARADERADIQSFFASLPLTLQRNDLRLVHAAWIPQAIQALTNNRGHDVLTLYWQYEQQVEKQVRNNGVKAAMEMEVREWEQRRQNPEVPIPVLPALAEYDETYQMLNPVRLLTSGIEQRVTRPFFAGGKWRMVKRVPWWNDYHDEVPVIMGHYWRFISDAVCEQISKGEEDLFAALAINDWGGARRNVFCVDFSVGGRYKERLLGGCSPWGTRLAAVRWPERELVFDEGERMMLYSR